MSDDQFRKALGARILAEANDLKRTPAALADELGLAREKVDAVIAGAATPREAQDVIRAMVNHYPVALADLWLEQDDTTDGVHLMHAADSKRTARVFDRKDKTHRDTPYYEYRDTAMCRLAPLRPEWIRPLRIVTDNDADNPDVAFNNGHLLHQLTFFIGEVNFYWRSGRRNRCAAMSTGDSCYITPFVPHSFTSRDPAKPGLIIAVTYGAEVRRALGDLSRLSGQELAGLAGDARDPHEAFGAKLRRHMAAESLTPRALATALTEHGVDPQRVDALIDTGDRPRGRELGILAAALNVRPADLAVQALAEEDEVIVRHARGAPGRAFPDGNRPMYRFTELARTPNQPGLKGFALDVEEVGTIGDGVLQHGLHQYVYNYGKASVELCWGQGHRTSMAPGDSAYVRPMVGHRFVRLNGDANGQLVVVRIPGALTDAALDEYAAYATAGRHRAAEEDRKWF